MTTNPTDATNAAYRTDTTTEQTPSSGDHPLFRAAHQLPPRLVPYVVNAAPGAVSIKQHHGGWFADDIPPSPAPELALTRPKDAFRFFVGSGGVQGRADDLLERYTCPAIDVEVNAGDRVVDVGAFLGEFSIAASQRLADVVVVEPDPRNVDALERTVERSEFDAIDVRHAAAGPSEGTVELQASNDSSESSILSPDDGEAVQSFEVEMLPLEELGAIDFLKVEAEGAEPEVLDGLAPGQAEKVAVNVDPERDGMAPVGSVKRRIRELGYDEIETRRFDGRTVFARY